jgi:Protein of unknown function (DUF1566)
MSDWMTCSREKSKGFRKFAQERIMILKQMKISLSLIVLFLLLLAFPACFEWSPKEDEESEDDDDDAMDDEESEDDDDVPGDSDDDAVDDDDASGDVWEDSTSGLMWQNASNCCYGWSEAQSYCQNLNLSSYEDWRLPSISELRSLIRGCDATETGGSCGVADSCLNRSCRDNSCTECSEGGDATDGCCWPSQLKGECSSYLYWSSSAVADYNNLVWIVGFDYGHVDDTYVNTYGGVRCVR